MEIRQMKEVLAEHEDTGVKRVIRSVVRSIGQDRVAEVIEHGIDGGFNGFIYYSETTAFWRKHKKAVRKMLEDDAKQNGVSVVEMVCEFNCLVQNVRGVKEAYFSIDEVARALYGEYDSELALIYNALAWYAAETVCEWFMVL